MIRESLLMQWWEYVHFAPTHFLGWFPTTTTRVSFFCTIFRHFSGIVYLFKFLNFAKTSRIDHKTNHHPYFPSFLRKPCLLTEIERQNISQSLSIYPPSRSISQFWVSASSKANPNSQKPCPLSHPTFPHDTQTLSPCLIHNISNSL